MVRHISAVALAVLATLAPGIGGCSDGSTAPIAVGVGPEGGTFALLDSLIIIEVPPGAVASRVVLTGQLEPSVPANALLVPGTSVRLGPTGTTFAQPITITVRYGAFVPSLPAGVREGELRIAKVESGVWTYSGASPTIDEGQNRLAAQFSSFSVFGIVGIPAATVSIVQATPATTVGNTVVLTAQVRAGDNTLLPDRPVSWNSLDQGIATVSANGTVTGVSAGDARIVAAAEGRSDTVSVEVTAPGGGGDVEPVVEEDFSTYTSTSNMLSNPRNIFVPAEEIRTSQIFLDESVGHGTSTKSMRYDFPDRTGEGGSGTSGRCTDYSISRMLRTDGRKHVWVEVYARFSANFTVRAPAEWNCTSAAEYKFLFGSVSSGTGRYNLEFQTNRWIFGYPGNETAVVKDGSPTPSSFWDGQWHRFRFEFKVSSSTDVADGIARAWVDDHLLGDLSGVVINRSGMYGIPLGRNMNQGPGQLQSVWWGRVRIYDSNPGW